MILADSNVWIALFKKDDALHPKASRLMTALEKVGITEYAVGEVCSVLSMKASASIANGFIQFITNSAQVDILLSDGRIFYGTLASFEKRKHDKLSFTDTSLLLLASEHKILTFDKNLAKEIEKLSP